ncbi:type IV secretion system protein [Enterobacter cloacae]|uniref:type IV secretion system protein n=1 Tax=Enterobacter cloacae TaxID=550 RepID=UPI002FFBA04C
MKIKSTLTALAVVMMFSSAPSRAGIPVFDEVANATELQHWTEKLKQWQDTVTHYKDQMNAYKEQLATATGVRDVQTYLNQAKSLANELKRLKSRGISLNDLLNNPGGAYSSQLSALYDKYKAFDTCPDNAGESLLNSCKQMLLNQAAAIEDTTDIQEQISDTLDDISGLADRIQNARDSKESADLANVVTARSIQLNALSTQWEMSVKQAELRNQLLAEQRRKAQAEQMRNAPIADLN